MRKVWAWVLVLTLVMTGLVGCTTQPAKQPQDEAGEQKYKIGLVTGTVSQGEDEYRAAEKMVAKYGDMITHVTYPDNFMQEQETTIAQITGLADDPEVKAIVICQAVPGSIAALLRVK
jgi:cytochrome c-type biogenesis protein CcmH/NrfF